jgi:large subunit ribosomal protein L15
MYRRFPKLKGIAGGMGAGKPKFVTVNVGDLEAAVQAKNLDASAEITIEALKSAGVIKATGYYRNLPLKVLGEGEVSGLKVKAASFSQSASEKLTAAGGAAEVLPAKEKWSRQAAAAAKA